jgi:hypothetical protein
MAKKDRKNLPQAIRNLRAACSGGAAATFGRSRTFADKTDILNQEDGSDEISEGVAAYHEKKVVCEACDKPKNPDEIHIHSESGMRICSDCSDIQKYLGKKS